MAMVTFHVLVITTMGTMGLTRPEVSSTVNALGVLYSSTSLNFAIKNYIPLQQLDDRKTK
jgi:hypothetical protein